MKQAAYNGFFILLALVVAHIAIQEIDKVNKTEKQ